MDIEVDRNAKIIWDYMLMHHKIRKMDAIFILGSTNISVADRAAELFHDGYAPYVLCSGGFGKNKTFNKPEAEVFRDRLLELKVPISNIILESKATNTGENIQFMKDILLGSNLNFNSFILVQKPYMERRTFATFKKQWPEPEIIVTSPQKTFTEYAGNNLVEKRGFIETMVGDLQRIKEYPKLGFQIEQDIPRDVVDAWKNLVEMGYTKYYLSKSF